MKEKTLFALRRDEKLTFQPTTYGPTQTATKLTAVTQTGQTVSSLGG